MVAQDPDDTDALEGDQVILVVVGSGQPGAGSLSYYWRKDGVTVMPAPHIMGENSATLVIDPVGPADSGVYDAVVINSCGFVASAGATLRVFCRADFNMSGVVSVQDIFDFLAAYFATDPRADFNRSGAISVQDIFDYLAAYFAGCP